MSISKITDHVTQAKDRLPTQHAGKTKIEALLTALVTPMQAIEDALWQLLTERQIDTAIGTQLDDIGLIVGEDRQGKTDDDYRRFLRARISVHKSRGTAEDILTVAQLVLDLTPDDTPFVLQMQPTAGVVLRVLGVVTSSALATIVGEKFLRYTCAAGVRCVFESTPVTPSELLVLDTGALDTGKLADATA